VALGQRREQDVADGDGGQQERSRGDEHDWAAGGGPEQGCGRHDQEDSDGGAVQPDPADGAGCAEANGGEEQHRQCGEQTGGRGAQIQGVLHLGEHPTEAADGSPQR
jgi:hypothetical protein